ncbi:MAG: hypothetical protein WA908_07505 [Pontixanthobacter sp.]
MSSEEKRQELKAKIEAAERRNADRTIGDRVQDASDSAAQFVKDHPVAAIAGVAVLGLAIGAMTRPGRRAGAEAGRRTSAFANRAAEIGMAYASGLFDAAGDAALAGRDKLEDMSDAMGDNARAAKRRASYSGGNAAAKARILSRETGKSAYRSTRGVRSRFS